MEESKMGQVNNFNAKAFKKLYKNRGYLRKDLEEIFNLTNQGFTYKIKNCSFSLSDIQMLCDLLQPTAEEFSVVFGIVFGEKNKECAAVIDAGNVQ